LPRRLSPGLFAALRCLGKCSSDSGSRRCAHFCSPPAAWHNPTQGEPSPVLFSMPKAEPPQRAGRAAQPIHWVRRQHKGQPKPAPSTSRINPRELHPHGRSRRVCSAGRAVHQSRNRPASPTCSPGLAIGTAQESVGVSHTAPIIDTTRSNSRSSRLKSTSCPATDAARPTSRCSRPELMAPPASASLPTPTARFSSASARYNSHCACDFSPSR
jgi:hypothetical protein